jgi:hypothetical protein
VTIDELKPEALQLASSMRGNLARELLVSRHFEALGVPFEVVVTADEV